MPMQLLIPDGVDVDLAALAEQGVQVDHLTASRIDQGPEVVEDPGFDQLTPLFEDPATGRVSGHIASKGVCHTGIKGVCITAPMSKREWVPFTRYDLVASADGSVRPVGRLSYGGGHFGHGSYAQTILDHDRRITTAIGAVGEDAHGIWFSGVRDRLVADSTFRQAVAMPHSGDWRRFAGHLELTEILAVDDPGYPVDGSLVASADGQFAFEHLVAVGIVTPGGSGPCGCGGDLHAKLDAVTAGLVLGEVPNPLPDSEIIYGGVSYAFESKIRGPGNAELWIITPVVNGERKWEDRLAVPSSDCTIGSHAWVWEADTNPLEVAG